jgi:hypothetical protein
MSRDWQKGLDLIHPPAQSTLPYDTQAIGVAQRQTEPTRRGEGP